MAYNSVQVDCAPGNVLPAGKAGAAFTVGAPVYLDSSGVWQLAQAVDASSSSRKDALGFIWKIVAANEMIEPVRMLHIRGLTSQTIGARVYLSTSAGTLTQTIPSAEYVRQTLGVAVSATEYLLSASISGVKDSVGDDDHVQRLEVEGTMNVDGAASFDSTVNVTGAASLESTLYVGTTSQFVGSANFDAAVSMDSTLRVVGVLSADNALNVNGAATLRSTLNVVSGANFDAPVSMDSTLGVTGALSVDGTGYIGGAARSVGVLSADTNVFIGGGLRLRNSATIDNTVADVVQVGAIIGLCNDSSPSTVETGKCVIYYDGTNLLAKNNAGGVATLNTSAFA